MVSDTGNYANRIRGEEKKSYEDVLLDIKTAGMKAIETYEKEIGKTFDAFDIYRQPKFEDIAQRIITHQVGGVFEDSPATTKEAKEKISSKINDLLTDHIEWKLSLTDKSKNIIIPNEVQASIDKAADKAASDMVGTFQKYIASVTKGRKGGNRSAESYLEF